MTQEAQLGSLMDIGVDLVGQSRLVAAGRQEQPDHLGDLLPGQHQPRFAALRVELGQLLAEQRQQQAQVERQRPARDQPRQR